jgi:D-alanyl-D-alanine carboxypeptidase
MQGSEDGRLCITGGGDPSLAWADLQRLAAAAAQQQKQQPVAFTSLTVDTSVYTGDVTPDTWEWGDLWAVWTSVCLLHASSG